MPSLANGCNKTEPSKTNENKLTLSREEKWILHFKEFLTFVDENGHGCVPHNYPKNQQLAGWVKRQRRQCKLWNDGKPSNITQERFLALSSSGFIWDAHELNWRLKLEALKTFRRKHGHCHVPTNHKDDNLGIWVKCQRRHYKLHSEGKQTAMNAQRIAELNKLGFKWEIHEVGSKKKERSLKINC